MLHNRPSKTFFDAVLLYPKKWNCHDYGRPAISGPPSITRPASCRKRGFRRLYALAREPNPRQTQS